MPKSSKLSPSLRLVSIVSLAAACGLMMAGPAAADPQEIKMVEHATTDAVTDTGAAGDSAGDILTFANEVFDAGDKNKIGTNQGICFRTVVGKAWECFWTVSLDKGQITPSRGRSSTRATPSSPSPAAPASTPTLKARWRSPRSAPRARPIILSTN